MNGRAPLRVRPKLNAWKPIALLAIAWIAGSGGAVQTAAAALNGLRAARASLDKAEHNKGGWRAAAIEATDKAIRETDRGCAFADTH